MIIIKQHEDDIKFISEMTVKKQESLFKKRFPDLYSRIMQWGDLSDAKDYDFNHKLCWYYLKIDTFPVCKICGKLVTKHVSMGSYKNCADSIYLCSTQCSNKYAANKREVSCIAKYGVSNPSKLQWVQDKKDATCLKRTNGLYRNPSQDPQTQALKKENCKAETGYEHYMQDPKRYKEWCDGFEELHGARTPMEVPQFVENLKQSNRESFGSDWYLGTKDCISKTRETCRKEGVEWTTQLPRVRSKIKDAWKKKDSDAKLEAIVSGFERSSLNEDRLSSTH